MSSKYIFDVPQSRGIQAQDIQIDVSAQSTKPISADTSIRDLILHAILVRIAYNDDCTEEFRTVFDAVISELDVAVDQDRLDLLTEEVTIGDKLQQFIDWLTNGVKTGVVETSGAIIATTATTVILADASSDNLELNLPEPESNRIIHIKKIDGTGNRVRVLPNADETIDGQPRLDINIQYASYQFVSDGVDWFII